MSDILIKGMEMPECCIECPLLLAYGSRLENKIIHHCMGRLPEDSRFADDADLTKRPKEGCPLVEVKPHGELIERDNLLEYIEDHETLNIGTLYDVIQDAPIVLEATGTGPITGFVGRGTGPTGFVGKGTGPITGFVGDGTEASE